MADEAIATIQVSVLPDEIRRTLSSTMTVTPADANDKFYYKLTSVSNSSTDLIAGNYLDYTAVDDDTAPTAVASIFLVLDAGTASSSATDGITIGQNEFFCARLPNTTVADIHAISSAGTVNAVVVALLDDVG